MKKCKMVLMIRIIGRKDEECQAFMKDEKARVLAGSVKCKCKTTYYIII